ncbi:hypothetical protein Misp01_45650 [Microtetraspora sp. NBRC 13810]|nr:hypothetical protein [Microtetraspora sp. NBRC 13810]GLW09436.1 hypothetical protein Misp01_45650 [Microtetraspora sp. NBRC 13810]
MPSVQVLDGPRPDLPGTREPHHDGATPTAIAPRGHDTGPARRSLAGKDR